MQNVVYFESYFGAIRGLLNLKFAHDKYCLRVLYFSNSSSIVLIVDGEKGIH
jgi:hypothetical protein